ncbi:aminoglycoside phosphotransferase family protein [Streptomyces sp. NPDC049813]|uniref:aminoglycoside phosphotransferase family protein n=1 Tax=Streptomyces sp. NPDC049813 TaxID=3365597 RepID=UPI00379C3C3E
MTSSVRKYHPGEADIDATLVRALVDAQFPRWSGLPLRHVDAHGTSNVLFRLGEAYVVRLPRVSGAAPDLATERRWLPFLAARLPVAVPECVAEGRPGHGFPYPWAVHRWLPGAIPVVGELERPGALAEDLAGFVTALRGIDTRGAPAAYRGRDPLAARDGDTRAVLSRLAGVLDAGAARAVWDAAVRTPRGPLPDVWLHADLEPGNLLVDAGRLSAVIDFACMGTGDPAVDLLAAWYVLDAPARKVFRAAAAPDADTWARGRGWALTVAAHELAYYQESNPFMARTAARTIDAVLAESGD